MEDTRGRRLPIVRPVTRGDCRNVPRPCPYVSCRFNLLVDVHANGSIAFNLGPLDSPTVPRDASDDEFTAAADHATDAWLSAPHPSCALDVIDERRSDEAPLSEIGEAMGLTRQRIDQIMRAALPKLRGVGQ